MTVRRSLAWSLFGQITSFLISFVGSIIVTRLLTPLEIGEYAIASAIIGVIGVAANVGISSFLIRERNLTKEAVETAYTLNAIISIALFASIFSASFLGKTLFDDAQVGLVMRFLSVIPLIGILEFLPGTLVQRDMQFQAKSVILMISTLIGVLTNLIFAIKGFSSLSFAFSSIAVALFKAVSISVAVPHHVSLRMKLTEWRPILVFGLKMILISGVAQLVQRMSEVIMGGLLGLPALGIYSRASSLSNLIFFNLYGSATGVVFSKLSIDYRETGVISDTFLRGLQLIIAFMWPLMIGLAILSRPTLYMLYGNNWINAAVPFSFLMLSQVIVLSYGMNWELFVLKDRTGEQVKLEIIRSSVGLAFFSVGCLVSLPVAALGRVCDALVGAILYLPRMSQLAEVKTKDLGEIYRKNAGLTLATVAPSLILMLGEQWSSQTNPLLTASAVCIGGVIWLFTLNYTKHPMASELGHLWRRRSVG